MWKSVTKFGSMMSLRRSTELPVGFCAESFNGDLGSSSNAAPLPGYQKFGHQANASDKTIRKFTYTRGDGTTVMLQVRDNGTNYIVDYLNTEDTRNSNDGEWLILEAGLSRTITLFDGSTQKANFGFTSFNDTGVNQLVYGNGVEALRIWNGAIGKIASSTATTITLNGSQTAASRGFSASGTLRISGTNYPYSGLSSNQFTGVGTDPTGEATGSGIAQAVDSSTLNGADKGSILLTALSRLFMAGMTATPNQVTFSDTGDLTSYSGALVSDGGLEDFPQMNGPITMLADMDKWIVVGSAKKIIAFTFEYPTSTTRVTAMKEIADEGCASSKGFKKFGNQIIYITPNGGIKSVTHIASEDLFNVQDLTEAIRPTIQNFVWDDAALEYSRKKRIMVAAGKSSSSVSDNDAGVMLFLTINERGEQVWNVGTHDWFIGDMCSLNGELHFGSSVASDNYKAFSGYSKNGAPYIWRRVERVEFYGDPWTKTQRTYLGIRGSMGPGSKLYSTMRYNLNGVVSKVEMELGYADQNADGKYFVTQQPLNTLGGFALGTEPLGGTMETISDLSPFKVVYELPEIYSEDSQLEFKTDGAGQQVVIDTYGVFVGEAGEEVTADEKHDIGITQ